MIHPHGYAVSRSHLRAAPTLLEALELMPEPPPRCSDIALLRQFETAIRWWRSEILWLAVQRERVGLNDRVSIDTWESPASGRGTVPEPPAAGPLPPAGQTLCGGGRAPAAEGDQPGSPDSASLPRLLTTPEVAALARVGEATVRRAAFETRKGYRRPGDPWFLPRARKVRAGFRREDVLAWLVARGQLRRQADIAPIPTAPELRRAM